MLGGVNSVPVVDCIVRQLPTAPPNEVNEANWLEKGSLGIICNGVTFCGMLDDQGSLAMRLYCTLYILSCLLNSMHGVSSTCTC